MSMRLGGIISGMDTQSIVKQLMQSESAPLYQMQTKQHKLGLKKDLMSEVSSSLSALQGKVQDLLKSSTFNPLKVSLSDAAKSNATLGKDATAGVYTLDVTSLADATYITGGTLNTDADTKAKVQSGVAISTAPVNLSKKFSENSWVNSATLPGNDTLTINGINFNFTQEMTVDDLMNQINGSAAGVIMSYDSGQDKFVIESKNAGSNAKIVLDDKNGFFSKFGLAEGTFKGTGTADLSETLNNSHMTGLAPAANTLYFKINGYSFNFKTDSDSLQKVVDTINKSGAGVVAFYDSQADKITFTNKDTGAKDIKFEDIQGNFLQTVGVYDPLAGDLGVSRQQKGHDAVFKLNGADMTRSSNNFDINGVTFTLLGAGKSSVNVTRDEDAVLKSIKDFVNQYNSTIGLLNARLSEKSVKNAQTDSSLSKGILRGESSIMNIASSIRQISTQTVTGITNLYNSLMDIGITTESADYGKSGKLVVDDAKLKDAIKNNSAAVEKLFLNDLNDNDKVDTGEKGVAASLFTKIQEYVDTKTVSVGGHSVKAGILSNEIDTLDKQYNDYDKSITEFNTRLESIEARYWRQFTAMEDALSKMNNQGDWLSSQLAGL